MKASIAFFVLILFVASCSKSSDPSPTTSDFGSWSYTGKTFKGVSLNWTGTTLVGLAEKPNQSVLSVMFLSSSPANGTYTITSDPSVSFKSTEAVILLSDLTLSAPNYVSQSGTATVSRSGSSLQVTFSNVKMTGQTGSGTGVDNIDISGTIMK
jgi:hypothetical protein